MNRTLVTVAFSHFCEKARFALDWARIAYTADRHLPMLHWAATFRAGGGRTVPVLVTDDGVLADSTDILRYAARHAPASHLLPEDPKRRAECDALEDVFDEYLGPAVRRIGYDCAFSDRRIMLDLMRRGAPRWQFETLRLGLPLARGVMRRAMAIDGRSVADSRDAVRATFDQVAARLGSRDGFLVGDRFSAADLTFAALAAPMVLPTEHPFPLPVALLPPSMHALVREFREHPAGTFALRVYAEQRAQRA